MRISDWSSDVCSSDLEIERMRPTAPPPLRQSIQQDERFSFDIAFSVFSASAFTRAPRVLRERVMSLWSMLQSAKLSRVRSEERRVGKEGVSTCRSRWSQSH